MMRCLLLTLPIVQIFASRFIVTPKIYYTIVPNLVAPK